MGIWIAQHFFHPAMVAGGAALVASPIIIHLINRMRFRRVRFAAMEFLLQSQQRNRRRVLIEQLILLLLRILIVLALLALIARLILDPSQLAAFRVQSQHILLVDDSGSMRDRWGETTAFKQALKVVQDLAAEGARRPDTQKFTLLFLSNPNQPLFTKRDVNDAFVRELETKLKNQRCTYRALDLSAGLDAVRKLFSEEKATIKTVHVISDFRRRDWLSQKSVAAAVKDLDEAGVTVNLVKTVPERHANLAVTSLTGDLQVAAAGVPLPLNVIVKNLGEQTALNVHLAVKADGRRLPMSIVFDEIEPGATAERKFEVVFDSPREHRVQVRLTGDAIAADNARFLTVSVASGRPVLIIDGAPLEDEAFYVSQALAPEKGATGFEPLVSTVDYLRKNPLGRFQSIYLLNVPSLPPDAVEPLKQYVQNGGGVAWFLGDAVNPAFYNDKLYKGADGLFPVPLSMARRELESADETTPGPDLQFASHPVFERTFAGQENPFIESVHIHSYLPVADDWNRDDNVRTDGVRTIAVLRNKQPLVFDRQYGQGRIIAFLTSAGPSWNDWARNPSFVTAQLDLELYLALSGQVANSLLVGQPIKLSVPAADYTEDVEIATPGDGPTIRKKMVPVETNESTAVSAETGVKPAGAKAESAKSNVGETESAGAAGTRFGTIIRQTGIPGVYRIKLQPQAGASESRWYAFNVPIEESDLELAGTDDLHKAIGPDVSVQIHEPGDRKWIRGKDAGQEVRNVLLMLLVILLVAEQLFAYKVSYHPRTAGATA